MKKVYFTVKNDEFKIDVVAYLYDDGTVEVFYIHPMTGSECSSIEQVGYGWSNSSKERYMDFVREVDEWLYDLPIDEDDDGRVFEI